MSAHHARQSDRGSGHERKAAVLDELAQRRSRIVQQGQRVLVERVLSVGRATADDVRAAVRLPPGVDPVCLGAVPARLARAGIVRRDGYMPTGRAAAHARPVSVWSLADRQAAEQWLLDHPERPDDPPAGGTQGLLFEPGPPPINGPGAAAATATPGLVE